MSEDIKFGCILPFVSLEESLAFAERINKSKFDSLWFSDHVIGIGNVPVLEQWCIASIIAYTTNLELGFATTNPYVRPPHILAQTATTLDILTKGKFVLGIGAGEAMNLAPYGINWKDRPVSRMKETIIIMKKLWTEENINYKGEFYELKNATLPIKNVRKPHPPIWIGGSGPRMLKITAELAEGWLPYGQTPELYKKKSEVLREYLRRKNKEKEFDWAIYLPTGVAKTQETAIERYAPIGQHIALLFSNTLRELGREDLVEEGISLIDLVYNSETEKRMREAAKKVPMDIVEKMCIIGSPEKAVEIIERFVDSGVRYFVVDLFGKMEYMMETVDIYDKEIIPHFKK